MSRKQIVVSALGLAIIAVGCQAELVKTPAFARSPAVENAQVAPSQEDRDAESESPESDDRAASSRILTYHWPLRLSGGPIHTVEWHDCRKDAISNCEASDWNPYGDQGDSRTIADYLGGEVLTFTDADGRPIERMIMVLSDRSVVVVTHESNGRFSWVLNGTTLTPRKDAGLPPDVFGKTILSVVVLAGTKWSVTDEVYIQGKH